MRRVKKTSIQMRQMFLFTVITLIIMGISLKLHLQTVETIREMTYEKMESKGEYYQSLLDQEISHMFQNQVQLLNERNLYAMISPAFAMEPYEEREALLSLREELGDLTSIDIVENAQLYIPERDYRLSPGNISRMQEAQAEEMEKYIGFPENCLNYENGKFFAVKTLALGSNDKENPNCVVVTTLSNTELEIQLDNLSTGKNSGAVYYNEALNALVGNEETEKKSGEILQKLQKDELGNYPGVSKVKLDGKSYLVFAGKAGELGVLIQYAEEAPVIEYIKVSSRNMIGFMVLLFAMAAGFIWYNNKMIHKPMKILLKAFDEVEKGNLGQKIYHNKEDEFAYLYQGFNDMQDRVVRLIDEVAEQTDLAQKSQLKQLQAQINPHFLYNSFFILSRRIKKRDFESAEEFAKHLGNYFKYLARDGSEYIPLEQEAEHAKSYASIQNIRFSNRIRVEFGEVPKECAEFLVPRLILQPLLENSFKYSLENKVADGILQVSFVKEEKWIAVYVEDNGDDITDEKLMTMQGYLEGGKDGEITGIANIHRRLRIYYKGDAGLAVDRSSLGGVRIKIILPYAEGETV